MAAPTNPANVKKALANSEPSTHGTSLRSLRCKSLVAIGCKADKRGQLALLTCAAFDHLLRKAVTLPSWRILNLGELAMWALRFLQLKRAGVVLALLLTAVPNQSALALTIFPFRTGMALDYDEDGTGELGVGTSTMQVYYNFPGIGGGGESSRDHRIPNLLSEQSSGRRTFDNGNRALSDRNSKCVLRNLREARRRKYRRFGFRAGRAGGNFQFFSGATPLR